MRILISGASGFIGSALAPWLQNQGHQVIRLVRRRPEAGEIFWNPAQGELESSSLDRLDAVIHLAGENIAGRWNAEKKQHIRDSRIQTTHLLSQQVACLAHPPATFISASAIGFYGNRGEEHLTEESTNGKGFLAGVARDWEAATQPAAQKGIRVVCMRTGMVLSPNGGALATMLTAFKTGIAGKIGSGQQYISWVALEDLIGIVMHLLQTASLQGPVNVVSPTPVTNAEFTKTLGRVLHRPTVASVPAFAAKLALGEMAEELLLASQYVEPVKLLKSGYRFKHPQLEEALQAMFNQ